MAAAIPTRESETEALTLPTDSVCKKRATASIRTMFAASAIHWNATFAAMVFLVSPTRAINRFWIMAANIFLIICKYVKSVTEDK